MGPSLSRVLNIMEHYIVLTPPPSRSLDHACPICSIIAIWDRARISKSTNWKIVTKWTTILWFLNLIHFKVKVLQFKCLIQMPFLILREIIWFYELICGTTEINSFLFSYVLLGLKFSVLSLVLLTFSQKWFTSTGRLEVLSIK